MSCVHRVQCLILWLCFYPGDHTHVNVQGVEFNFLVHLNVFVHVFQLVSIFVGIPLVLGAKYSAICIIMLALLERGRLHGATVVCSRAGEIMQELAVAIASETSIKQLALVMHAYPTFR